MKTLLAYSERVLGMLDRTVALFSGALLLLITFLLIVNATARSLGSMVSALAAFHYIAHRRLAFGSHWRQWSPALSARRNEIAGTERASWSTRAHAAKDALLALGLPLIILGGIYTGTFTPTEAAAGRQYAQ